MEEKGIAQFLAVCRRAQGVALGMRRPRRGARFCRRCALPRWGEMPRLRQILRAIKRDKLSGGLLAKPGSLTTAKPGGVIRASREVNLCRRPLPSRPVSGDALMLE